MRLRYVLALSMLILLSVLVAGAAAVAAPAGTQDRAADVRFATFNASLNRSFAGQLVSLTAGLAAGLAAYLVSCRLLRVRELNALLTLLARRGGR